MAKLLSASQVLTIKRKTIQLEGAWGDCLGVIDRTGVVLVWGQSGNGKSSAVMSLAKELTKHGKVLYVSLEEGCALSFQNTLRRYSMQDCKSNFQVVTGEDIEAISERLSKRRSADFVVIDSFQYTQLNYKRYLEFKKRHSNKLIIFVSHADGRKPAGRAAESVKYDADQKIWVEGFKAISNGRYMGATGEYVIWEKGAKIYWACKNQDKDEE
jgi:hypothetical protein